VIYRIEDPVPVREVRKAGNSACRCARTEGNEDLRFLPEEVCKLLLLRIPDRTVEEANVDETVLHGLDVLVLRINGHGPEEYVSRSCNVKDRLVDIQDRDLAAAAACRPVECELKFLVGHAHSSFRGFGPISFSFPTKSVTIFANFCPSEAEMYSNRTLSGSMFSSLRSFRISFTFRLVL